jgi:hypothetical protein
MSEPNAPLNRQGQSESVDSAPSSETNPFTDAIEGVDSLYEHDSDKPIEVTNDITELDTEAVTEAVDVDRLKASPQDETTEVAEPWSNSFAESDSVSPMPLSAIADDAVADDATPATQTTSKAGVRISATSAEAIANPATPSDISELIGLVQELNQCNGVLLDRVSQLEDALERSQNALQAEIGRSQDSPPVIDQNPQDLATAQEQIITLFNQLEFGHQTNQRQQILIETLTGQLENSQERIAQLEREAALIQQRYNEQAQLLVQSENTCRDLQARLQRQQRYTLQFKAALEKCLEVPTPQYESSSDVVMAVAEDHEFLPKTQRIEPWSAQVKLSDVSTAWMKLHPDAGSAGSDDNQADWRQLPDDAQADSIAQSLRAVRSKIASLKLPSFSLPATQIPVPEGVIENPASTNTAPPKSPPSLAQPLAPSTAVSYNLKLKSDVNFPAQADNSPDSSLMQQLDAVVQPLADMLAEAMLAQSNPLGSSDSSRSHPATSGDSTDLEEKVAAMFVDAEKAPIAEEPPILATDTAEDALWQDLARLIDASTEDVVKASLSGDLSAFEAIDFDAARVTDEAVSPVAKSASNPPASLFQDIPPELLALFTEESPQPPCSPEPGLAEMSHDSSAMASTPASSNQREGDRAINSEISPDTAASESLDSDPSAPSWPAPVVYPMRPTKKRQSLGNVDLPSFL